MKSVCLPVAIALALVVNGLSTRAGAEAPPPPTPQVQQALVDGNNAFGLDLYSKLKAQPGNIFFSPFSISSALAMTYAGARGETEKQMAETLHFDLGQAELHPAFAGLMDRLTPPTPIKGKAPPYQLTIANALWGQQGYPFLPAFLETTGRNYEAAMRHIDFGEKQAAAQTINDWVSQETNKKITDLISPNALSEQTRLVLTNAIYFKGKWETPFKKERTQDGPFTVSDGTKVDVPMMHLGATRFAYGDLGNAQLLRMPYLGGRLSMLILLPKDAADLGEVESQLTAATLAEWIGKMQSTRVVVTMPKFTTTCQFSLGETLQGLGMKDAFSAQDADFSGMDGKRDLAISAVLHKAFVDVNEEGTEAAAATAIMVGTSAAPMPPVEFRADHPFVFMIRDDKTGSILFIGRMMNPKE